MARDMASDMTAPDVLGQLAGHKTLGSAPPEELAWLASHGTLRHMAIGDVLTAKGTQVEGMFVVLSGRIAIFIDRGAGFDSLDDGPGAKRCAMPRGSS
jgi:CRP-like cAMP-binding protein